MDEWVFTYDNAKSKLLSLFKVDTLKGFGIDNLNAGIISAGAIIDYLDYTHHERKEHIKYPSRIDAEKYVWIDKFSTRNLEIFYSNSENGKALINIIDNTISPMGGRQIRRWLALPLKNIAEINFRSEVCNFFVNNKDIIDNISNEINKISDIERLSGKISYARINPKEFISLKNSLKAINPILNICSNTSNDNLIKISSNLKLCNDLISKIEKEINPERECLLAKEIL